MISSNGGWLVIAEWMDGFWKIYTPTSEWATGYQLERNAKKKAREISEELESLRAAQRGRRYIEVSASIPENLIPFKVYVVATEYLFLGGPKYGETPFDRQMRWDRYEDL